MEREKRKKKRKRGERGRSSRREEKWGARMALAPKSVFPLNFRPFFFPNPPRPSCANCVWGACNKPYAVPVRCSYVVPWRRGQKPCINTGGPLGIPLSCLGKSGSLGTGPRTMSSGSANDSGNRGAVVSCPRASRPVNCSRSKSETQWNPLVAPATARHAHLELPLFRRL
ncbi:hypothetical protein BJX66DRAFT_138246 [Aspergillus keveii]|uniref:Uncharacterized protein n=1 Tax=Aspergillus keveii TaxID=714993 RepID=A0ABR4FIX0_9EURO